MESQLAVDIMRTSIYWSSFGWISPTESISIHPKYFEIIVIAVANNWNARLHFLFANAQPIYSLWWFHWTFSTSSSSFVWIWICGDIRALSPVDISRIANWKEERKFNGNDEDTQTWTSLVQSAQWDLWFILMLFFAFVFFCSLRSLSPLLLFSRSSILTSNELIRHIVSTSLFASMEAIFLCEPIFHIICVFFSVCSLCDCIDALPCSITSFWRQR